MTTSGIPTFTSWGTKRREKETKNLYEELMTENIPNLVKEIGIQPQEVQSPKQEELKQAHNKTHYN